MKNLIRAVATGLAIGTAGVSSGAVVAQAVEQGSAMSFDIRPQALDSALNEFRQRTKKAIMYTPQLVANKKSAGVKGSLEPMAALSELLKDTGLKYSTTPSGTIVLAAGEASGSLNGPADQMRMADGSSSALSPALKSSGEDTEGSKTQIIVRDRKVKPFTDSNVDIPRTVNDIQPYYILDEKVIERSGAATIEELLKQQLPMNAMKQTRVQTDFESRGATSGVNLRGLGEDKTLILVNGRRQAGVQLESRQFQPDLNGIPVSAVERVEVLPTSGSGIYGGGALGGVVNIVLKRNYQGGGLRAVYENTWDTDAPVRSLSAMFGVTSKSGRTSALFATQISDASFMLQQDRRELLDRGIQTILRNNPSVLHSVSTPFLGSTTNITNAVSGPLVLRDGTVLGSSITHIQPGSDAANAAATLGQNSGSYNLDLPSTTLGPTGLLRPFGSGPTMKSISGVLRTEPAQKIELFIEYSHNENASETVYNPFSGNSYFIPDSAPTNPFRHSVRVRFPNTVSSKHMSETTVNSLSAGTVLRPNSDTTVHVDLSYSRTDLDFGFSNTNFAAFFPALNSGVLNPFQDTLEFPIQLDPYLTHVRGSYRASLFSVGVRGATSVWDLRNGSINVSGGIEWRRASTPENSQTVLVPLTPSNENVTRFHKRGDDTVAAFVEGTVPILGSDDTSAPNRLELQVAGRVERFKTDTGTPSTITFTQRNPPLVIYNEPTRDGVPFTDSASYDSRNYTVGFKYSPIRSISLRASYGTAFVPPTPDQLVRQPAPDGGLTPIFDPQLDTTYEVQTLSGGNPSLKPENSEAWSAGVILERRVNNVSPLRINLEWYRITQLDKIGRLATQDLVSNLAFESRVTRDAITGQITTVDQTLLNLTRYETNGMDLSVAGSHASPVGVFHFQATGTYILSEERQTSLGGDLLDYAGYSDGPLKKRGVISLEWDRAGWSLGWTVRYFDSYFLPGAAGDPSGEFERWTLAQGDDKVKPQVYQDLTLGFEFQKAGFWFDGVRLQGGVKNLFDTLPPLDVSSPYYTSFYGDKRLRTYWLSAQKSF